MVARSLRSLQRLAEGLQRSPHDYRASLQVFPDLDAAVVARQLNLHEVARKKGAANVPPEDSKALDEVEQGIVERILSERKAARQTALDQLETYSQRLAFLDLQGRFSVIQQAAPAAVTEFRTQAQQGRDELHELRRRLSENEIERSDFRDRNRLVRAPRVNSTFAKSWKISFLIFLFIAEAYGNTILLAKGNELGYAGAAAEAAMFAVLNVVVSFFIAFWGGRQMGHRSWFRKLVGFVSLLFWIGFALVLNAALAHYREISGSLLEDAGSQVISRLYNNPIGLEQIKSWLFFGFGLVASIGSFADGMVFKDPYPGYSALEERVRAAHSQYRRRKEDLIAELHAIKDDAAEKMEGAQLDLGKRKGEHDAILANRLRLIRLYDDHQELLEVLGNKLLAEYHGANVDSRSTPAPARFSQPWVMIRSSLDGALMGEGAKIDLEEQIRAAQQTLSLGIAAMNDELERAVRGYHQIDDLEKAGWHGPSKNEAA